ncbi:hypothetical protein L6R52_43175, partial [Myxococcota bacterium]|nr:hypothetical protein [Myxococcota bacterium]
MPSILEVMREYKHLSAMKRAEGSLPPPLEERLAELEGVVRGMRSDADAASSAAAAPSASA